MAQTTPNSQLEKALALAALGIPVFPCNQDKSPAVKSGFKAATTDPVLIKQWWRRNPKYLIGMPTGSASGLWVIDADIDKKTLVPVGDATLAVFGMAQYRHRAKTRSGGSHYFFAYVGRLPANSAKKLPGVDVRSEGGYVIAWDCEAIIAAKTDKALEPPPVQLVSALRSGKLPCGPHSKDTEGDEQWGLSELKRHVAQVAAAVEGSRQNTLNIAAFYVGVLVACDALHKDVAVAALRKAALSTGLDENEVDRTIARAMADAQGSSTKSNAKDSANSSDKTDKSDKTPWGEPDMTLLHPVRAEPPPFPTSIFPHALVDWIKCAAETKGAPFDYVAVSLIGAVSSLIGNARWASAWPGWHEPPAIWPMLVGTPSSSKSPGMDAVLEPLGELERELHRIAKANFKAQQEDETDGQT